MSELAEPEKRTEERTETHSVCLDTISRQSAIDAVVGESREVDSRYLTDERIIHECDAVEVLSYLPSAEPERHGRWIVDDEYIDCSVCRREKWSRNPYEPLVRRFRFCPNCGARMDGEQE